VEALETEMESRQEAQEFQKPVRDLEQRLAETSSDIIAKQSELKSLAANCEKLMSTNDDDHSDKIDRKRYLFGLFSVPSSTTTSSLLLRETFTRND